MKNRHMAVLAVVLAGAMGAGSHLAAQSGSAAAADRAEGSSAVQNDERVTGTVREIDANRLVVELENGQQMTFVVTGESEGASSFRIGDRVTASYISLAGTGAVISKVVPASKITTTTTTTYTPPPTTTTTTTRTTVTPPPAPVTTPVNPTPAPSAPSPAPAPTVDAEMTTLPATGSSLPLVGLIGLVAAGGAVAVRRLHLS
jgi:hypothetical protein